MKGRTISETLFERFCTGTGIPFTRLDPDPSVGRRTPDYEIHLQEPSILIEVKQIDPNYEDRSLLRRFNETGEYRFNGVPGNRLRGKKISKAGSQLRARVQLDQPTLIIFYNNVDVLRGFTAPQAFMAAMYGRYQTIFSISQDLSAKVLSVANRLGGGRIMTHQDNTTFSGLAALFNSPEGPYLVVYHNRFAAVPLRPKVLRIPRIFQYSIHERNDYTFPEWRAL